MDLIRFADRLTLEEIESQVAREFETSERASGVVFDLQSLKWTGYYPAVLLINWVTHLRIEHEIPVVFRLPPRERLPASLTKTFLLGELLARLHELGVEVPYYSSAQRYTGVPFRVLSETRTAAIKSGEFFGLGSEVPLEDLPLGASRDVLEIVLRELLENACIHGQAQGVYYGLSMGRATGSRKSKRGVMATFSRNVEYTEIVLGDLGPGINARLASYLPRDYKPPFIDRKHSYIKEEKVLALAFEFSSTSDEQARKGRLQRLLERDDFDPNEIASGLFVVMEAVRARQGQLLVRSPGTLLSLDFTGNRERPVVRGRKELALKKLAHIPGTHFLIRIPHQTSEAPVDEEVIEWGDLRRKTKDIRVLEALPSRRRRDSESWSELLHIAVGRVDNHLRTYRGRAGLTLIPAVNEPLPSRVAALFLAALRAMNHGARRLVWVNHGANLSTCLSVGAHGSSRLPITATPVIIGDLLANRFSPIPKDPALGDRVRISEALRNALIEAYAASLQLQLQETLQQEKVRQTPGPFLIPGQYYTTVFYSIGTALASEEICRDLAEWCLIMSRSPPEVLVIGTEVVLPLAKAINNRLVELGRAPAELILYRRAAGIPANIAASLPLFKKTAMVLTDVICSGSTIKDLLNTMGVLSIEGVISLVDARAGADLGNPLAVGFAPETRLIEVVSVVSESIEPKHDEPRQQRTGDSDTAAEESQGERIYVIDETTHEPTLYVRPIKPRLPLEGLLEGAARESGCLIARHCSYEGKHYTFFLQLGILFSSLRQELQDWIRYQIEYIDEVGLSSEDRWWGYIYNPDESLDWAFSFLSDLPQRVSVEAVSWEKLKAPTPPREDQRGGKCVVLLPAIESGEVARRCIELVSRYSPQDILVLCVLARMEPYHLTFLSGLSEYRGSRLHVGFFIEFPIKAYGDSPSLCPVCRIGEELKNIGKLATRVEAPRIREIIKDKLDAQRPLKLDYMENLTAEWKASEKDRTRALIRALYQAAEVNIPARRRLNALLSENKDYVDRFLEVLAFERASDSFRLEVLEERLFKGMRGVYSRLDEILWHSEPPLALGRFVGALIHLRPYEFVSAAASLIARYVSSTRDVAEVCVGLISLGVEPGALAEVFATVHEDSNVTEDAEGVVVEELLVETRKILLEVRLKEEEETGEAIAAFPKLWARITRSGSFTHGIDGVLARGAKESKSVAVHVEQIFVGWAGDVADLLGRIFTSAVGQYIFKKVPQMEASLARLHSAMGRLSLLRRIDSGFEDLEIREEALLLALELQEAIDEVDDHLYRLMVHPAHCSVFRMDRELPARDGSVLEFTKTVDYQVPHILCFIEDLDFAVGEIVENWVRHKVRERPGERVWVRLEKDGQRVVLELGDNIEGEFRLESEGGLRAVREFGLNYGVDVSFHQPTEAGGEKYVTLSFRAIDLDRSNSEGHRA